MRGKLTLNLEDLSVDSFDTTAAQKEKGTVFGEQCTCYTQCTCPGCPTCYASCNGTCDATCAATCAYTCYDVSCAASCNGTCAGATCGERCYTGEPDTCQYTWCYGNACN